MQRKDFEDAFLQQGFVHVRQCVETKLLDRAQQIMAQWLSGELNKTVDCYQGFVELTRTRRQFEVQEALYKELHYHDIPLKVLRHSAVLDRFMELFGPDLAYSEYPGLPVNVKGVEDDYYVKKWHQEYWSGMGIHTVGFWFPLAMKQLMGGVEYARGSHLWGHIPHRNREPMDMPQSAEIVRPDVQEGDGIFFHSLTVHRTVPNELEQPRFALSLFVKNLYYPETGIGEFKTWHPFRYSPLARIHKALGNPAFSPFRTVGSRREGGLFDRDDRT